MNSDSAFKIGNHEICQDYSFNIIINNKHYIIVSDGCSGSKNTDIGSRLLTLLAVRKIYNINILPHPHDLIISMLQAQLYFHIDNQNFDATLLMASSDGKIYAQGDGVIVIYYPEYIELFILNYSKGYPAYLSYLNDEDRFNQFSNVDQQYNIEKIVFDFNWNLISNEIINHINTESFEYNCANNYKKIILLSDGIFSFYKKIITETSNSTEKINYLDILKNLLDFKSMSGKFVSRSLNAAEKNYNKNNIFHYDDISIAVINQE